MWTHWHASVDADDAIAGALLCARGVRRVFAVDVERVCALEWSRELGTWQMLELDGRIDDPALAVRLPTYA